MYAVALGVTIFAWGLAEFNVVENLLNTRREASKIHSHITESMAARTTEDLFDLTSFALIDFNARVWKKNIVSCFRVIKDIIGELLDV